MRLQIIRYVHDRSQIRNIKLKKIQISDLKKNQIHLVLDIYASISIKNYRKRHLNVRIFHLMSVGSFFFFFF